MTRAPAGLLLGLLVGCATRPAVDPAVGARAVLDDYRRAIATSDLRLFLEIWPGLTDEMRQRVQASFSECIQTVEFETPGPKLVSSASLASCVAPTRAGARP